MFRKLAKDQVGEVDGILCIEVLEHLPTPEAAVRSFASILRPGGRVFLTIPTVFGGLEEHLYATTHGPLFPAFLHVTHFTEDTLANLFHQAGFQKLEVQRFNAPDESELDGSEGDFVEILSVLKPLLEALRVKPERQLFAVFEKQ